MKKALILIDLQNDYFEGGKYPLYNTEKVLENIEHAINIAKEKDIEIIAIQHIADSSLGLSPFFNEGTEGAEIHNKIKELVPNLKVVKKAYADGFYQTNLEEVLQELEVNELLICGMMTQNCVTHTAISKQAEKYKVKVLQDCCTTVDEMLHFIALHAVSTRVELVSYKEEM